MLLTAYLESLLSPSFGAELTVQSLLKSKWLACHHFSFTLFCKKKRISYHSAIFLLMRFSLDFMQISNICRSSQSFCSACCRSLPLHFPLLAGVNLASNSHRSSFQTGSSQQNAESCQNTSKDRRIVANTE